MRKRTFLPAIILISLIFNQVVATVVFAQHHDATMQSSSVGAVVPSIDEVDGHSHDAHGSDHDDQNTPPLFCHCPMFLIGCSVGICADASVVGPPVYTLTQPSLADNVGLRGRTVDVDLRPPRYIS